MTTNSNDEELLSHLETFVIDAVSKGKIDGVILSLASANILLKKYNW